MKCLMTVAAAALALAAFAEEPAKTPARPMPMRTPRAMMGSPMMDPALRAAMNPKIAEQLGLSDEQKAKLAALRDEKGNAKELQEKVRKGMERQAELLKAEKIDEAAVMATIDEVFEARKELAKEQTKRLIAAKAILTPEQVAKAISAMKAMRAARAPQAKKPEVKPAEKSSAK